MKKILLAITGLCFAYAGMAQNLKVNTPIDHSDRIEGPQKQTRFKKKRGQRLYSYISAIDVTEYGGQGAALGNPTASPMWQDTTILQRFSTGYGAINYSSFGATIRPSAEIFNSPSFYPGEMEIDANQPYTVDSIILWGIYMTPNNTGATPGDKITVSVVTSPNTITYLRGKLFDPQVATDYLNKVGTTDTAIYGASVVADSVAKIGGETGTRTTWDYMLTNADTSAPTATGSYFWKRFAIPCPSPIAVPAGGRATATFTFFTGGTWNANVDSVSFNPGAGTKNHFRARFYEENDGQLMNYRNYSEKGGGDFCNSIAMFSFAPDIYYPSLFIETFNTPAVSIEHLDVDWVLSCTACGPVATNEVVKQLEAINVYPNPAADELNIQLDEVKSDDVNVTIYSMTGKKLVNQVLAQGSMQTSINIADFAAGIYLCEMEMNGEKNTVKITKK